MFEKKKVHSKIQICQNIDTTPYFWCREAILIEVTNGKSALHWKCQRVADSYYYERFNSVLTLNNKPILQASLPSCPTCEGLLATGYGIDNIECSELREIADKINETYTDITNAAQVISPILGLLEDGVYILADCDVYPSDGNGHFFWDVPNELTVTPATAICLTDIEDKCDVVGGIPTFLYPSQSTTSFNPERISYYQSLLNDREYYPRSIAYYSNELCSVILDGHHKATACAINGMLVPTLVIVPCTGIQYKPDSTKKMVEDKICFGEITLPITCLTQEQIKYAQTNMNQWRDQDKSKVKIQNYYIIEHNWESVYADSYLQFPNVREFAEEKVLDIQNISKEDVSQWLCDATGLNARKLESAIRYYLRRDKEQAKILALQCGRLNSNSELMKTAFNILTRYKNDSEVEQFFIDWLVEDNDPHSILRKIADRHWS